MKKKHMPKDIEDLADMYYDPSRIKEKEKWESHIQNMRAADCEKDTVQLLSKFGKCDRIPQGRAKTFDYKIDESKILVDATTINPPTEQNPSNDVLKLKQTITEAVNHVDEKDSSEFPGYARGGVVWCIIMCELTDIWEVLENDGADIVSKHGLDYMVFVPAEPSTYQPTIRGHKPIAFVRRGPLPPLFKNCLPDKYRIVEI